MEQFLHNFLATLEAWNIYYIGLGLLSFTESLPGIGQMVPGAVATVFAGFMAYQGQGALGGLILAAGLGSAVGDFVSYLLGARMGSRYLRRWRWRPLRRNLARAQWLFARHGGKSLFFVRFFGPLRGLIPFVAGAARMRPGPFIGYTIINGALWGLVYPSIGFLGGASWERVHELSQGIAMGVVSLILLLIVLNWWLRKRKKNKHAAH